MRNSKSFNRYNACKRANTETSLKIRKIVSDIERTVIVNKTIKIKQIELDLLESDLREDSLNSLLRKGIEFKKVMVNSTENKMFLTDVKIYVCELAHYIIDSYYNYTDTIIELTDKHYKGNFLNYAHLLDLELANNIVSGNRNAINLYVTIALLFDE
jgi:hypothetical protein